MFGPFDLEPSPVINPRTRSAGNANFVGYTARSERKYGEEAVDSKVAGAEDVIVVNSAESETAPSEPTEKLAEATDSSEEIA